LEYVLGYTVGNDISSRHWQKPEISGSQHGYAKSFDKFAPLGPVISSPNFISDPGKLSLKTHVNGDLRQDAGTDDLIFDVSTLIRHFNRGMTLRKGTVIMTGTPSGVGVARSPPTLLRDGDVVEVEISGIGRIKNRMVFET
jgi:2-keto-4-pentenoate hydratase/2-oxohepta-3-ene-1,7-dioic acid hydratase in catechol pathway